MTMDRDRLAQALMATFLEELEGHVAALNRDLLALEKATTPARAGELMNSLLRTVHSVKGASRAVSVGLIETACHRLEEVLAAVDNQGPAHPELMELCFATADALDDAGRRLATKQDLKGTPLEELLPRLEAAAQSPESLRARALVPTPPEPARPAPVPLRPPPPPRLRPPPSRPRPRPSRRRPRRSPPRRPRRGCRCACRRRSWTRSWRAVASCAWRACGSRAGWRRWRRWARS
ncbi:Hpt domain-containing protein [Cystobacter fuscus]